MFLGVQGDCWICMELMSICLDQFYRFVHGGLCQRIPENILGQITLAVRRLACMMYGVLDRDVGYKRICDRIFCQNPHIAYFCTYNGIFRIAYAKIMLHMAHMQKFAYMQHAECN